MRPRGWLHQAVPIAGRRLLAGLLLSGLSLLAAAAQAAIPVERVTAGGIEAWLVEDHRNPIIAVRVAFRSGAALDPEGREGLAAMAMALLDEGAGDLDSQQFQGRLEDLAIRLWFDADHDSVGGTLQTLTRHRDEAFRLLSLALASPRFDPDAVERVRRQLQSAVRQELQDPDTVARRRLFALLFPQHPYGRPVRGTDASLARITGDDLRGFVRTRLARDALIIGVAGDITRDDLAALLPATFAALPETAAPAAVADVVPVTAGQVTVADMDVPQSAVAFAQAGLKRDDPDYYTALVLNEIVGGGGLTSVLFEEVRERRGLVYGVYSTLLPLDHAGVWLGGAATGNQRVNETVTVVRETWSRLAAEGVKAEQVADAKTHLTGSFPLRFTSSARIAGLLAQLQLDRLGIDYLDRRNRLIEVVTPDQVNRLARTRMTPAALTFVIAGRPR